jgi:hypothetical protein
MSTKFDIPTLLESAFGAGARYGLGQTGQSEGGYEGLATRWVTDAGRLVESTAQQNVGRYTGNLIEGLRDSLYDVAGKLVQGGYKIPAEAGSEATGSGYQVQTSVWRVPQRDVATSIGTAWMHPVAFVGGTYDVLVDGKVTSRTYKTLWLPPTTMVTVDQGKEIAKSMPNAGIGTTKQLWAFMDHEVLVRGLILPEDPYFYDSAYIRELRAWSLVAGPIRVVSQLLADNGITHLCIERGPRLEQLTGKATVLSYSLNCTSDEDPAAIINSKTNKEFGRGDDAAGVEAAKNTITNFTN